MKKDAAAAAGVCAQTVSEWLKQPNFSAALQAQRRQLAGLAVEKFREGTDTAVATVMSLMQTGSDAIRLRASMYYLDRILLLAAGEHGCEAPTDRTDIRDILAGLGVNI